MTPRTLFNIILKILGIFFIKDFLAIILQLLSVVLFLTKSDSAIEGISTLVSFLMILLVYGLVSYFLIFKTEMIIDKLKLDKGFDHQAISLNIHRSTILSISIIVIGGMLVVDELPNLCRQLFSYYQERRMTHGQTNPNISYSVLSGVKIVIGLLIMTEQRKIVNLIERQRKK